MHLFSILGTEEECETKSKEFDSDSHHDDEETEQQDGTGAHTERRDVIGEQVE